MLNRSIGRISDRGVRALCGGVLAVGLSVGTGEAGQRASDPPPPGRRQTVAVLPFVNLSRAEADQWIGSGIAETLAADLHRVPGIDLLARDSFSGRGAGGPATGAGPGRETAALQVSRELGAAWLIAGAYQRVGDRLRITARLIAVATGAVVHTIKVDGRVEDLFVLQDRLVDALGTQLGTAPDRSGRAARETTARVDPPDPPRTPPIRPPASAPGGARDRSTPRGLGRRHAGGRVRGGADRGHRRPPAAARPRGHLPRRGGAGDDPGHQAHPRHSARWPA